MMIRLYYLLKDVMQAKKLVGKLLLKQVNTNQIHVIAKEGTNLKGLPEASLTQRSDLKHSIFMGLSTGALLGLLAGFLFHYALEISPSALLIVSTILGAFIGGFSASLVGVRVLNVKLQGHESNLDKGDIMVMVDIPQERDIEIENYVKKTIPNARLCGIDKRRWRLT